MKSRRAALFDEAELRELAGDKTFARGQDYADHGHIALVSATVEGVLAAAFGTSDYTVWLARSGREISGHCSCPAYRASEFCKHMVATALVVNERRRRGDEVPDRLGEIAGNLAQLGKSQLEALLLEMMASDWRVLRSLSFALGVDWEDDFD